MTENERRECVHKLCELLNKAVEQLLPDKQLVVEHSIGGGFFCCFKRSTAHIERDLIAKLKAQMQVLQDKDVKAQKIGKKAWNLVPYKGGMLLLAPDRDNPARPAPRPHLNKLFKAFEEYRRFNEVVGITNVSELNEAIKGKYSGMFIQVIEALHTQKFSRIAEQIARRFHKGGARVVLIAGPSSSGKTTSSKRLAIQLATKCIRPKIIELDNYFVNRDNTPLDANGEWDFESLYALDLEQLNTDLNALIAGKEVAMPTYNFKTGQREYRGNTLHLEPNEVLLMEGIHGLNPELTKSIPEAQKFRVYVSALTTLNIDNLNWISTTDNRLLRRIVRDHNYRGTNAQATIARWPSVRRGEDRWIFPYQESADAIVNSSLFFELAVMKDYALPILEEVPRDTPERAEADRLINFLAQFEGVGEDDVPRTSLLREFLGGSIFST